MAYIHPDVLDNGLTEIGNATALHIISGASDPVDRTSTLAASLGNMAIGGLYTLPNPTDRGGGGREIVIPAVTEGTLTAEGSATRWAFVDGTRLLACTTLATSQSVPGSGEFTLASFTVGFPNL